MADADVIPIGTRGRPGRGTGTPRPSSAARGLAATRRSGTPTPARRRTSADADADRTAADSAADSQRPVDSDPADQRPTDDRAVGSADAGPVDAGSVDAGSGDARGAERVAGPRGRPPVTARGRGPLADLPIGELLAAVTGAAREVFGDDWEPRLAALLALARRRLTGDFAVDDFGFDPELTGEFLMAALRPLARRWFRIEVYGLENLPAEGGALVVSNHSGTLPLDGLMTMTTIHDRTGRFLRPLGADLVFKMPVVSKLARAGGATLACHEDAERLLREGHLVGVWPEGFKGIGKPFSERYKLQRFGRGGFVSAALRTGVPIVPLSVVGAEEIYPLVGNIPALARLLGVPYIPITPLFPLLGPLGLVPLPSKWLMEFGEPVRTDEFEPGADDDPMLVFNVTDQVRESIQQSLYTLLERRPSVFG